MPIFAAIVKMNQGFGSLAIPTICFGYNGFILHEIVLSSGDVSPFLEPGE
jgi:hypothetical protein